MHIFQSTKKRVLFLLGMFVTGIAGMVGDYWHANYSKSDSLIIPTAQADFQDWAAFEGAGCGGCSAGGGTY